jgi:hypothetical protein
MAIEFYRGKPEVELNDDKTRVHLVVGSCCYDCRIEELTADEAIQLGSILQTYGKLIIAAETKASLENSP